MTAAGPLVLMLLGFCAVAKRWRRPAAKVDLVAVTLVPAKPRATRRTRKSPTPRA